MFCDCCLKLFLLSWIKNSFPQGCPSGALGPGQRTKPRSKENRGYGLAEFWLHQALDNGKLYDLSTRVLDLCPHQRILCVPKVASKIILGETDVDCI